MSVSVKSLSIRQILSTLPVANQALLLAFVFAVSFGFVMVASSSIDFAAYRYNDPWFFARRHAVFLVLAAAVFFFVLSLPSSFWQRHSSLLLIAAIALLCLVLIPGVGKVVNGSRRWLPLGPINLQASELAKFCLLMFFASFLAERRDALTHSWSEFARMILIMAIVAALLLLEPDFGSAAVITATLTAMMFVAGVRVFRFLLLLSAGIGGLAFLAVSSSYRWERLITFMDPWQRQFDSGYQLVQSLIAFGRGEWTGLGLGNSIQKLFFLPEAHTDFIFAIIAEELGFIGVVFVLGLFTALVVMCLLVARRALAQQAFCQGFFVFGVAVLIALQAFINMGVASGFLPTKGLTLPFLSYGGSSLLVMSALMALVFRIEIELYLNAYKITKPGGKAKAGKVARNKSDARYQPGGRRAHV